MIEMVVVLIEMVCDSVFIPTKNNLVGFLKMWKVWRCL